MGNAFESGIDSGVKGASEATALSAEAHSLAYTAPSPVAVAGATMSAVDVGAGFAMAAKGSSVGFAVVAAGVALGDGVLVPDLLKNQNLSRSSLGWALAGGAALGIGVAVLRSNPVAGATAIVLGAVTEGVSLPKLFEGKK